MNDPRLTSRSDSKFSRNCGASYGRLLAFATSLHSACNELMTSLNKIESEKNSKLSSDESDSAFLPSEALASQESV